MRIRAIFQNLRRADSRRWIMWSLALAVFLAGQMFALGAGLKSDRGAVRNGPRRFLSVGDTVTTFPIWSADGVKRPLDFSANRPTVILVFKSTCVHCRTVAPQWRTWMSVARDANVLVLANELYPKAASFATEFGWTQPVFVTDGSLHRPAKILVSRTPWIYVLDSNGVLLHDGHGSKLGAIDSIIAASSARAENGSR